MLKLGGAHAETGRVSAEPLIQPAELPFTFSSGDGATIVNFGLITGREATQAEIDRLAQLLTSEAKAGPDITIVSTRRQDYGLNIETITHQIRARRRPLFARSRAPVPRLAPQLRRRPSCGTT